MYAVDESPDTPLQLRKAAQLWAGHDAALSHRSALAVFPPLDPSNGPGSSPGGGRGSFGWLRPVVATIAAVVVLGAALFMVVPSAGTARALAFPASLPHPSAAVQSHPGASDLHIFVLDNTILS